MPSPLEVLLTPLGIALRHRRSGEKHSVLARPGWNAPHTITLTSGSFANGGRIDDRHSALGRGQNLSPQLRWTGVPPATRQLVLAFEDLDFPFDRPGLHTLGILPPHLTEVAEGALGPDNSTIRWVPTHGGDRTGYAGPRPLPGHGTHHYRFHLIALDNPIFPATPVPDIEALDNHVAGHAIALGTLEGTQDGWPSRP